MSIPSVSLNAEVIIWSALVRIMVAMNSIPAYSRVLVALTSREEVNAFVRSATSLDNTDNDYIINGQVASQCCENSSINCLYKSYRKRSRKSEGEGRVRGMIGIPTWRCRPSLTIDLSMNLHHTVYHEASKTKP